MRADVVVWHLERKIVPTPLISTCNNLAWVIQTSLKELLAGKPVCTSVSRRSVLLPSHAFFAT